MSLGNGLVVPQAPEVKLVNGDQYFSNFFEVISKVYLPS